jgi:DNA-binding GntR family transcriptional regulator
VARYLEIADDLRKRLLEGEWAVGDYIPSIGALMREYEVNGLNTVRRAEAVLVEEGLLAPLPARGYRVLALPTGRQAQRPDAIAEIAAIRQALDDARTRLGRLEALWTGR